MAEQHIKLNIGSNANLTGFEKIKGAISSISSRVTNFTKKVGSNLMNIKAGLDMLKSAFSGIKGILQKSMDAESLQIRFKTLIGSMDEAKAHMQMLQEMGNTPPFSMEEFAAASQSLMKFSGGVLGYKDTLTLLGDAAQATGVPLEQLAEVFGKSYAIIRDGAPISKAVTQLQNMGIVTPELVLQLKDMESAGATNSEMWEKLTSHMQKYKGAMDETLKTGNGLFGAIEAQMDNAKRDFGSGFLDQIKDNLSEIADKLSDINNSGNARNWGQILGSFTSDALDVVTKFNNGIMDVITNFRSFFRGIGATFGSWFSGEGFWQGLENGADEMFDESASEMKKHAQEKAQIEMEERKKAQLKLEMEEKERKKKAQEEADKKKKEESDQKTKKSIDDYYKQSRDNVKAYKKAQEEFERKQKQLAIDKAKSERDVAEKEIAERQKQLDQQKEVIERLDERLEELTDEIKNVNDLQKQDIGSVNGWERKADRNNRLAQQNADNKQNRRTNIFNKRMENLQQEFEKQGGRIRRNGDEFTLEGGKLNLSKRERDQLTRFIKKNELDAQLREEKRRRDAMEKELKDAMKRNRDNLQFIRDKFNQFITVQTAN